MDIEDHLNVKWNRVSISFLETLKHVCSTRYWKKTRQHDAEAGRKGTKWWVLEKEYSYFYTHITEPCFHLYPVWDWLKSSGGRVVITLTPFDFVGTVTSWVGWYYSKVWFFFFEHISFLEIILLFHFWKFHMCIQYILAHLSPTPSLQLSLSPNISFMSLHQFHVFLRITHWSIWICPYVHEYTLVNRHSAKYFWKVLLLLPTNVCRTALAIVFYMWRHSVDTC